MLNHSNSNKGTFLNGSYISRTNQFNTSVNPAHTSLLSAINDEKLCVLRLNNSKVEIDFLDIINPLEQQLIELTAICENPNKTITEIIDFIKRSKDFNLLTRGYSYCENLAGTYQGVYANNQSFIGEISETYNSIVANFQEDPEGYDYQGALISLKLEIKNKYVLWCKAYAIDLAYKKCTDDDNVLTYSHRITGWADPVYQLTPNFSLELKTNFGYGSASYFYTRLKYKNIDITPFSDWVHYRFAQFNDIIRYSKSHVLTQQSWYEAMLFTKDACNLSLSDEKGFVNKYIIGECEAMVSGLERILTTNEIQLLRSNEFYKQKFNGHELVVFRGEKITGALDFITKILQFEGIAQMSGFVKRIENSNRKLYPYLVSEIKLLEEKITKATQERIDLQPEYDTLKLINQEFKSKKQQLFSQMITSGKLDKTTPDLKVLENAFHLAEPGYAKFSEKFNVIQNKYAELTSTIMTCTEFKNSISLSIKKVKAYFR
jgi:hypothetical protein